MHAAQNFRNALSYSLFRTHSKVAIDLGPHDLSEGRISQSSNVIPEVAQRVEERMSLCSSAVKSFFRIMCEQLQEVKITMCIERP